MKDEDGDFWAIYWFVVFFAAVFSIIALYVYYR